MILTTIALVAQASPAASAAPAATAAPAASAADLKVAAVAKAWFISLQHGKVLDPSQLTALVLAGFTPDVLTGFETQLGPLGDPISIALAKSGAQNGGKFYIFDLIFKTGDAVKFAIVFDSGGKISGLRVLPPQ